jgi:hypothetical protein
MICSVKSFGILYFLLRIGDPAADLRASQKTACGAGQIHHGRVDRPWHRKCEGAHQIPGRLGDCQPARLMSGRETDGE